MAGNWPLLFYTRTASTLAKDSGWLVISLRDIHRCTGRGVEHGSAPRNLVYGATQSSGEPEIDLFSEGGQG